eukprot:scaffold34572_cov54-Attheya_sp.AAC.1
MTDKTNVQSISTRQNKVKQNETSSIKLPVVRNSLPCHSLEKRSRSLHGLQTPPGPGWVTLPGTSLSESDGSAAMNESNCCHLFVFFVLDKSNEQ